MAHARSRGAGFGGSTGFRAVVGVHSWVITPSLFLLPLKAPSDSQAALITYSDTHTLLLLDFFILPECLTNLSVRACQSVRAQWCVYSAARKWPVCLRRTTWVPVSLSAHSAQLILQAGLLPGRTDKAGYILTPVKPCSPLSQLNAVQDAAVLKCCGSMTMAWLRHGRRITQLTARLFYPELIHAAKTSVSSLG